MNCANKDCFEPTSGKSKYCYEHKLEARARWKNMVQEKDEEKKKRYALFERTWRLAQNDGEMAVDSHTCTPMVVEQHANMLDDSSPVTKRWHVPDGVCGFAWIRVPGNSSFAHWARKNAGFKSGYDGTTFWVHQFGQSYEKKNIWARAVAERLREDLNIKAYAMGRVD